MDRVAVFVDAGYLYAGGAKSITGADDKKRHELSLDISAVVTYLIGRAEAIAQHKLLRIYWYDAASSNRPQTDHQILASSDNVKLRLGVLNGFGQQKGVDGKIITDLAELSRNGAFADAVLLGGDEDLRLGVELAQERGARVHLLTVEGSGSSPTLRQECDTVSTIARVDVLSFLSVRGAGSAARDASAATALAIATDTPQPLMNEPSEESLIATRSPVTGPSVSSDVQSETDFDAIAEGEVRDYLAGLTDLERVALVSALKTGAGIPSEHDGRLLARIRNVMGRPLEAPEKPRMRRILKQQLGL